MPKSQGNALLFLVIAVVLFFFSLSLLPPVELYCRFQRPAIFLLILQIALVGLRFRVSRTGADRALVIGTFVFSALGLAFNTLLLVTAQGKC
jgi:hypothetical protein